MHALYYLAQSYPLTSPRLYYRSLVFWFLALIINARVHKQEKAMYGRQAQVGKRLHAAFSIPNSLPFWF